MLCSACAKRQLTAQEEATEQKMCYFCLLDYAGMISERMGAHPILPTPEQLGRDSGEIQEYVDFKANKPLPLTSEEQTPSTKANAATQPQAKPQDATTANMQKMMLQELLAEPPFEYELVYNEDHYIKVKLPGPVSEKLADYIEKFVNKLMWDTVQIRMQGSIYESYLKDPKEPPQFPGYHPQMG